MYKHTQFGWVTSVCLGAAFLFVFIGGMHENPTVAMILAFILFIAVLAFASLRVAVTADYIHAVFGIGLIRIRIKLKDIAFVSPAKRRG